MPIPNPLQDNVSGLGHTIRFKQAGGFNMTREIQYVRAIPRDAQPFTWLPLAGLGK